VYGRGVLLTVGGAVLLCLSVCAVACPTDPATSWVYPYIDELRLREGAGGLSPMTAPYGRLETAAWLEGIPPVAGGSRDCWLEDMLKTDFADEAGILRTGSGWTGAVEFYGWAGTDEAVVGETFGRYAYYSPLGLCFWTSLRATLNGRGLHKVATRPWKDNARASVDFAGLSFHQKGFSIGLERDEVSWGTDRRAGLLFSGSAPAFDMLRIAYRTKRVGFTSFHARLRPGPDEDVEEGIHRYVAAHRLEVFPTPFSSLAISEAVVYGGRYRSFEPVYMNPLTIFYADQWNSDSNDNILIAGDFSFLFPGRAEIRGEVMIDDFQYDFETEPHEVGAGMTLTAVNPFRPATSLMGAFYYRVANHTYGHVVEWNRFIQEGRLIGYPDGPDTDKLGLWLNLSIPVNVTWTMDYTYRRKGEGSATEVQGAENPGGPFPSGTVETTHAAGLEVVWRPSYAWQIMAGARYSRVRNAGHEEGARDDDWEVVIGARYNLELKGLFGD
jgi:hypothetical protein